MWTYVQLCYCFKLIILHEFNWLNSYILCLFDLIMLIYVQLCYYLKLILHDVIKLSSYVLCWFDLIKLIYVDLCSIMLCFIGHCWFQLTYEWKRLGNMFLYATYVIAFVTDFFFFTHVKLSWFVSFLFA